MDELQSSVRHTDQQVVNRLSRSVCWSVSRPPSPRLLFNDSPLVFSSLSDASCLFMNSKVNYFNIRVSAPQPSSTEVVSLYLN